MKIKSVRSYTSKNGNKTFVYAVSGTKEELEKLPLPVKYRAHKQTKKASSELHEISTQLNLESNSMFNNLFVQSLNIKEAEE